MPGQPSKQVNERRFWQKVEQRGADDCWEWRGSKRPDGYGQLRRGGRRPYAHRVAYEYRVGPIPDGGKVLHSCDNPGCVNPQHLRVGTLKDNAQDREARGRRRNLYGEEHGSSKLLALQVVEIRRAYAAGEATQDQLATRFGVARTTIGAVICRRNWRGLP